MNVRPPTLATCAVLFLLSVCAARASLAQIVLDGRVLDDVTNQPIPGSRVFLLNRYKKTVDVTNTDAAGHFVFRRPSNGWYRLEVHAVGYQSAVTSVLWMTLDRDFAGLEVRLSPNIILLAPVEIVALSPPKTHPILANMEFRRSRGMGVQITREQIQNRNPQRITDMLTEIPGVYADRQGPGTGVRTLRMQRALPGVGGGECPVQVWVDGLLASRGDDDVGIDNLVAPGDVEDIEIFRGLATVPPEFLNQNARCGVIAIWTRRTIGSPP
jgi:hypothetical protein